MKVMWHVICVCRMALRAIRDKLQTSTVQNHVPILGSNFRGRNIVDVKASFQLKLIGEERRGFPDLDSSFEVYNEPM